MALETLLFHGERARTLVEQLGTDGLDEERKNFLERELARTSATLEVRLVDDDGQERLRLREERLALGVKHHVFPEHARGLQPPEISGTIKRVGVQHLWARL